MHIGEIIVLLHHKNTGFQLAESLPF